MVSDNTYVKIKIQYRTRIVLCKVRDINMYNCTQGDYDGSAQQTVKCNYVHLYIEAWSKVHIAGGKPPTLAMQLSVD